ncbi:MAG TPA: GSCFA domain-containing protein, partial [Chitinophagaceae bacterium]|nr:GSCFA domain-containing protein [Chitinophagaceae bacterium]
MDFLLPIQLPKATEFIYHQQKILSIGSCFTEHIGNALSELKFNVLQNPNGILFDPASVCNSIVSYIQNKQYSKDDLFQLNEVWQSWQFHSRFSGVDADEVIKNMNESGAHANKFLKDADWLIITLGSSFSYRLVDQHMQPVANCHRAPQQWFQKYLMPITETVEKLDNAIHQLFHFNKKIDIIFTISPVRHVR